MGIQNVQAVLMCELREPNQNSVVMALVWGVLQVWMVQQRIYGYEAV